MKHTYVYLLSIIYLLFSCVTNKEGITLSDDNNIILYDNYESRSVSLPPIPNVLIFKRNIIDPERNTYESYCESGRSSILGKWKIEKDTLYLTPVYHFFHDSVPEFVEIDPYKPEYFDYNLINQKWLIKGNRIYDRTDYSIYNMSDEQGNIWSDANKLANRNYSLLRRTKAKLQ